jgi:hypothetical protein
MRRYSIQLVLVCLGATAVALATSSSAGAPVALLSEVDLKTTNVRLSDLLPADAPASLRAAGDTVALGRAPMAGSIRHIARKEIEHALVDQSQILAAISIPTEISIRRVHRRLSPAEVAAAISAALGHEDAVDPAKLNLQLSPLVTSDDPGLEVTGIDFDAFHQVTRFRLWTAKEPANMPFYVTAPGRQIGSKAMPQGRVATEARAIAHSEAQPPSGSTHSELIHPDIGAGSIKSSAKGQEMLVKAGVPTQLVIEGADYRLTSTVIPLQPGALGQEVRARDPLTQKILSAQVAGPGLLKGTL